MHQKIKSTLTTGIFLPLMLVVAACQAQPLNIKTGSSVSIGSYNGEQHVAIAAKTTRPSGLIFENVQQGTGKYPKYSDTVRVHYRGTLANGTEFDSSYQRNQPLEFPLSGVIACWTEGVQMMQVGGKARLTCPAKIAYGASGAGGKIPPNATLTFEVHLLAIAG